MKKMFASLLALSLVLVGCGGGKEKTDDTAKDDGKKEIIMLTDKGTIDDKSFNQGTYEGVKAYADKNGKTYTYIKPVDATDDEYKNSIDQAVKKGAKIIVTPGYLFEPAIYAKQTEYKDVKFILIDGYPNDGDQKKATFKTEKNAIGIKFQEEQSGYLAGYAAVKEGHTKLGFMGGMAVPAVMSFGYGYVQGANDAAKELGVEVTMNYHYTGDFKATPEVQNTAASWYKSGITCIFGCGGAVGNSVMAAAEKANPVGAVIGVDVDQASESKTVMTSAYKQLSNAVSDALDAIYSGDFDKVDDESIVFRGGQNIVLGAANDAIGLPMETSTFKKFTKADYDKVYQTIKDGKVTIKNYEAGDDVKVLNADKVKVNFIK
ncbi:MAG: BMP family lipoprotein [Longibaculum sp.]